MDWYPPANLVQRFDHLYPGTYTDNGEPKGLLHTTETSGWPGYNGGATAPHMTFHPLERAFRQHFPLSMPSRALRNLAGGVQTNRDRVFQIELIGTCDPTRRGQAGLVYWPEATSRMLDDLAGCMRWVETEFGVPRRCLVTFLPYPASYGNTSVRLDGPAFDAYSGWLGHMHAAENDHGDPGNININYLLGEGDDMFTDADRVQLNNIRSDVQSANIRITQTIAKVDQLAGEVAEIQAALAEVGSGGTIAIEGEFRSVPSE